MDYVVKIMPSAENDLTEIGKYIASYNPNKAYEFVESLQYHFKSLLSLFPESGIVYENDVRKISHQKYTAFYNVEYDEKVVNIIHIIDLGKPLETRGIEF